MHRVEIGANAGDEYAARDDAREDRYIAKRTWTAVLQFL